MYYNNWVLNHVSNLKIDKIYRILLQKDIYCNIHRRKKHQMIISETIASHNIVSLPHANSTGNAISCKRYNVH